MHILVTGGAGYIGSYVVPLLVARGDRVTVVDNLTNGHADAVQLPARLIVNDAGSIESGNVEADAIIHLASRIGVSDFAESHWINNVGATLQLLQRSGARKIVFASSAAVYGDAIVSPIREDAEIRPLSAYGQTKVAIEQMLDAFDLRWTALRLFNVAGGRERHKEETHILPLALRGNPTVFGLNQMKRDYVHVEDVADAFIRALDAKTTGTYNIGTGIGTTIPELFACIEKVTGRCVEYSVGNQRAGDPSDLVANIERARTQLGWSPKRNLEDIVGSTQ